MRVDLSYRQLRFLLSVYLILVYFYGVFASGAWSDDYAALLDPSAVGVHALRDSRPVYGYSLSLLFNLFDSTSQLSMIRFIGLIGLILLNNEIWIRLRNYPKNRTMMVFCTLGLTLPSFQFSAHWAIAFAMSWAGFLGLLGFRLFSAIGLRLRFIGLFSLMLSFMTYPLVTFIILPVLFIEGILKKDSGTNLLKRLTNPLWYFLLGGISTFFISALIVKLNDTTSNARVAFVAVEDVPSKLIWFFSRPWSLSFRPYLISSPSVIDITLFVSILSIVIFVLLYSYYNSLSSALSVFLVFNLYLVLSLTPLLLVSQNQIDVRFLGSNTWLVVVTLLFLLSSFFSEKFSTVTTKVSKPIFLSLLIFGFWSVNDRYLSFIQPVFVSNNKFIESKLATCKDSSFSRDVEIIARSRPWGQKDLLGSYSQVTDFASSWVPEGAVASFIKTNNLDFNPNPTLRSRFQKEESCHIYLDDYKVKP
jgi:hypothetical protein